MGKGKGFNEAGAVQPRKFLMNSRFAFRSTKLQ